MRKLGRLLLILFLGVPGSAQAQVQPTFFGIHVNKISSFPLNIPVGSMRLWDTHTAWAHMCPTGPHCDFKHLDDWLAAAKRNGISDVTFTFGKTPEWVGAYPPGKPGAAAWGVFPPKDLTSDGGGSDETWKTFVKALVDHNQHLDSGHSKIKYWGIWNEPSAGNFWRGTPEQLVRMAKDASAIIKAADPSALMLSPELDAWGRQHDDWFDNYVSAGGGPYIDVVAFHAYATARDQDHPVAEDVFKSVAHVKDKVARHPELAGKPLWNTEGSWGSTDDANWKDWEQAKAFVVRFYVLQASAGVQRVYWYMYDPNTTRACCGAMVSTDKSELPAAGAFREVHKWLLGRTVSPCTAQGATSGLVISRLPDTRAGSCGMTNTKKPPATMPRASEAIAMLRVRPLLWMRKVIA
jgi:hypothetical protein